MARMPNTTLTRRLDATITVTVTVTNVDEDGAVTLPAAQPQVGTELTATLTDPDGGVSGATWKWESSPDGTTGWAVIEVATSDSYTPAAEDAGRRLRATASYTDGHGPGKTAQAVSEDAVNSAPEFPATETAARSVAENTAAGENIGGPVAATDAENDPLTYTLGGADGGSFDIEESSGQLKTKAALDFETQAGYTVAVTATDPSGASDTVTVAIAVTDEGGAVTPVLCAASGWRRGNGYPHRPRRRRQRRHVEMGEFLGRGDRLGDHRWGHVRHLYARGRGRGQAPARDGVLHRRTWYRQDRPEFGHVGAAHAHTHA